MNDFLNEIELADQTTVEAGGASYPFIQYVNGLPQNKKAADISYTGGWFLPHDQAPDEMPASWHVFEKTLSSGDTVPGYAIRHLTVAVIRWRQRWVYQDINGQFVTVPWNAYRRDKNMRGHRQVLVGVRGLPGIYILTMKGMASVSFKNCFQRFNQNILGPANALVAKTGRKWPQYSFWLTLFPEENNDGEPVFTTVGSGNAVRKVTLMACDVPENAATRDHLNSIYVGGELLKEFAFAYREAEEWAKAWDSPVVEDGAEPTEEISSEEEITF